MRPTAAAAFVFGILTSAASLAVPFSITLDPAAPTWHDDVTFTVHGAGCGAVLGPPTFVPSRGFRVDVHDNCPLGVHPIQYSAVGHFPVLPPAWYTLDVVDDEATLSITVLIHDISGVGLPPDTLASSDDATPLDFVAFGSCLFPDTSVTPGVVNVRLSGCPFEPPTPTVRVLSPPIGTLPPGTYEARVFEDSDFSLVGAYSPLAKGQLRVRDATRCFPADERLCLHDGRFAVTGHWRAFDGSTGPIHASPLPGSDEAGTFWFFAPDNTELTVKVLDGCVPSAHWWVFVSSASTVEYEVVVTDTTSGHVKTYRNELGQRPSLLADTAYEVCP
jgi:hypothetical protein